MVISLLGPYLWTCWCALQSPSCAGGLLQLTIVMADCRGGLRVAVARVQIDVRIRCLSGFSRDHTAGVAWAIVGTHACTRIRAAPRRGCWEWCFGSFFWFIFFLRAPGRSPPMLCKHLTNLCFPRLPVSIHCCAPLKSLKKPQTLELEFGI